MFKELIPLLAYRSLTITVAALGNEQVRINVVPHSRPEDKKANEQINYSHKSEVASVPDEAIRALTTPVSITGTAEEIDANLATVLSQYVASHVRLQDTFDQASTTIAEAVKAIDDRNKAKAKDKASKKEEKTKAEEPKSKTDDNLPLWWTDQSAQAPGSAQSSTSSGPNEGTLTQPAEVAQQ